MERNFKVSVLVPIYNAARYLEQSLNSLMSQTLRGIEIICINDGSTDESYQILQNFLPQFQSMRGDFDDLIIIDKANSGYGDSMNAGLARARGEYLAILEPDDFAKPVMLAELYQLAQQHDADLVKADFYYYYGGHDGGCSHVGSANSNGGREQIIKAGKVQVPCGASAPFTAEQYPAILSIQSTIWSAIYRRSFLLAHQINFLATPGASYQDTSFNFKTLALAKRIVFTPNAYIYYRQDNPASSIHAAGKVFAICREFDELTKFLEQHPKIKRFANTVKLINQYRCYLWNARQLASIHRDVFLMRFAQTFQNFRCQGELSAEFYRRVGFWWVRCLLRARKAGEGSSDWLAAYAFRLYRYYINYLALKSCFRAARRRWFSVRIGAGRASIILFGRQCVKLGM